MVVDKGTYRIKCVKPNGQTLTGYDGYDFAEGAEVDLLDDATSATLRAGDYWIADNMCRDIGFEIAQRIQAGEFVVVEKKQPDFRVT